MSEAHKPVGVIFDSALELPPERRPAYLIEACGGDDSLRQRVEALLRAHESAEAFMDHPAVELRRETVVVKPAEQPGDRIGRYKLLQQIGEGGCGVVYMAEQEEPVRRRVALKVIKLGMDTRSVIARFEAERQALALMDHPNIAKVLDAGATETGRPYFVMELVRGIKITDYCDQNNLPTRERLDLFIQVCRAIQHAHQKGIIHRDIKPSNILVTMNDGVPLPKVIDFGIAKATQGKLTDQTLFTAFEQLIGTPAYMSPEQAELSAHDIDTRSDIYSLGVLLYELLTGQTPFDTRKLLQAGLDEIRRTIREQEPPRPSTRLSTMLGADLGETAKRRNVEAPRLVHLVRGDLDWIVMKCLEKDRTRRYDTANGLAMDITRHLNCEPVLARPPSRLYEFQKTVRRHSFGFAAAAAVIGALVIALGVATQAVFRAKRDAEQIRQAKDEATEKLWGSYLAAARATRNSSGAGRRFDSLEAVRKAAAIHPDLAVRNEAIACMALADLREAKCADGKGHPPVDLVCYDYKLERYAIGETNGIVKVRAVADDQVLAILSAPGWVVRWIYSFSPNSRYLTVIYYHRGPPASCVWVWDLERQTAVLKELPGEWAADFWAADFSADSRFFARCHPDSTISIYDLVSGKEHNRLSGTRQFTKLILNPNNTRLACSSQDDPRVEIREVESGRNVTNLVCPSGVSYLAWTCDGKRLAAAGMDQHIYLWSAEDGSLLATLEGHEGYITGLTFNHAGNLLASAGWDHLIRLWDVDAGCQIASYPGGSWVPQFSLDDRFLLGWQDGTRYGSLELACSREFRQLHPRRGAANNSEPQFSADGRILATFSGQVRFWDVFYGKEIGSLVVPWCDAHIFMPDGQSLIFIDRTNGLFVRPLERSGASASPTIRLGLPRLLSTAMAHVDTYFVNSAALSRDGRYLAVTHETEDEAFVFDLRNSAAKPVVLKPAPRADEIAISPDGRWVATTSYHGTAVSVWDAASRDVVHTLQMPDRTRVAFSPDGQWLATSTTEYQLWSVGSWQPKGPPKPGYGVASWNFTAFSPDSRVMARTIGGNRIQLLETATEKPLATLEAPGVIVAGVFAFSPDGTRLAARYLDVQLWDLRLIRQELAQMGLDWDMPPYPPIEKGAATGPVILKVEPDPSSPSPTK